MSTSWERRAVQGFAFLPVVSPGERGGALQTFAVEGGAERPVEKREGAGLTCKGARGRPSGASR